MRLTNRGDVELTDMILDRLAREVPQGYRWPGNVRELEQAIRRILLSGRYEVDPLTAQSRNHLLSVIDAGTLTARGLLGRYAANLHRQLGSYQAVAQRLDLEPRSGTWWKE